MSVVMSVVISVVVQQPLRGPQSGSVCMIIDRFERRRMIIYMCRLAIYMCMYMSVGVMIIYMCV